jgi:tetratricopeptide (TPR) repeat protein
MEPLLAALVPSDGRWRWWLGAGVIALVAVAAVFAWRDPRVDPCAQWDHALGEPWSPEHAQAITAAFEASELPYATATARRAVERLDAYAGAWGGQRRRLCEAEPARAEDGPTDDATLRAACYERARDGLGAAVEVLQTADADLVARAHSVVDGLPPLEHCADVDALRAEAMAWPGEDPGEAIAALSAEQARAAAWLEAGRFADAARVARAARDSAVVHDAVAVQAQLEWVLARAQARLGDDAAETTFRSGLAAALRARADHLVAEIALDFAFHLANDLYRVDEARQLSEIGAAIAERPRTGVRLRAEAASIAGTVDQVAGRLHPAAAHHRRALEIRSEHLGSAHLDVAVSRTNLGLVLFRLGEHEAAIAEHRAALDIRRRALGEEHPEVAGVRNNLAIALEADGQYEEAEAEQRASLAASIAWFGPRHRSVAKSYNNLAIVLHSIGRDEEAAEAAERAIEIFTERVGERSDARGDLRGAASDFARAAEIAEDVLEPDQPVLGRIWANLADARSRLGEHESAESLARRALDLRRRQLGPEHGETAGAYARLAEVLYAAGRNDDAHAEAERLWAIVESGKVRPWLRVKAALLLVRGLATRDLDRARRIARETLERTDEGVASRDEVVAWLDAHG